MADCLNFVSSPKRKTCPESLKRDGVRVFGWDAMFDQASTSLGWTVVFFRVSTIRSKISDTRWSPEKVMNITGTPGQPAPGQSYNRSPALMWNYGKIHQAHAKYAPQNVEPVAIRSWKIYKSNIITYGATPRCPGCKAIESGKAPQSHTVGCRLRIEEKFSETEEGKLRLTRAELRKDAPHP